MPVAIVEVLGGANLEAMTPPAGFCAVPELSALAKEVVTWDLSTPVGKAAYKARLADIHRWADDTRKKLDAGSEKLADFSQPSLLPGPLAEPDAPTNYYNKSINPIVPFAARGFIIKPLQRNLEDPMYGPRARAMVLGLQDVFKAKDMPVAFFEMRPPMYWEVLEVKDQNVWPMLREKQHLVSTVPKTSILAAHNFGIDPRDTGFWGRVACRWALTTVNGDTVCCGPTFRSLTVDDGKVVVTLDHVGKGLMTGKMVQKKPMQPTPGTPVGGFELADQQGQWHPATAAISGPRVIIQCEKTARPSAVRYAWAPQPDTANLFNQAGFAALPWRAKIDK